jgi:hypothetical protein
MVVCHITPLRVSCELRQFLGLGCNPVAQTGRLTATVLRAQELPLAWEEPLERVQPQALEGPQVLVRLQGRLPLAPSSWA